MTDLESGGVEQHIDAAISLTDLFDDVAHGLAIEKIDLVIEDLAAGGADRVDRRPGCSGTLEGRQFPVHLGGGRPLPASLDALEEFALEPVRVGREAFQIGILRIRLRGQIQQVEGAARGRRQIGDDGRDDAAGRAGDQKDGLLP